MNKHDRTTSSFFRDAMELLAAELADDAPDEALAAVVAQWLAVLPKPVIRYALRQVRQSPEPLHDFRALITKIHSGEHRITADLPPEPLSQSDLEALKKQDRLEAMSDQEYIAELTRRLNIHI
ncbi:MAG TPA: hypothetical protein GXX29_10015 [Firmicutes bacterium]|nr:hypothetical protein [Bacillota bacterium]